MTTSNLNWLRSRWNRDLPGEPFATTKVDYIFNLIATGLVDPTKLERAAASVAGRLLPHEAKRPRGVREIGRRLLTLVESADGLPRPPATPASPLGNNIDTFAKVVGLSQSDVSVLTFALAYRDRDLREFVRPLKLDTTREIANLIALATGEAPDAVDDVLSHRTRLLGTGLVSYHANLGDLEESLDVDRRLFSLLARDKLDGDSLLASFLPAAPSPTLSLSDFDHIREPAVLAGRILGSAVRQKRLGTNILLVGSTGTGKSELARVLAREVGLPLLVAGREDEEGASPDARERLTSLLLGGRLVEADQGMLLFDEFEDLFREGVMATFRAGRLDSARMSKQWFNHHLETNPLATIWIANDVAHVDPAFLRRFTLVIDMPALTARQRRRAWIRHLGSSVLTAPDLDALVSRFEVSPAEIGNAVSTVRLALDGKVDRQTLEAVLTPTHRLVRGRIPRAMAIDATYDPSLTNTPVDLERLVTSLKAFRAATGHGVSLCLYGPPGTGKSGFAQYLARRLDRRLVPRRASDLLSAWLGESEKRIAAAFGEAQDDEAVLLFDEVDSFLSDRRNAVRSWEVSQTNEFLQQVEEFSGIVVCTTNLFDNLDQAALRRFTFKIPFDYLTRAAATSLFQRTLAALGGDDTDLPDTVARSLSMLRNLTPGDFAATKRRLSSLGETPTAEGLLTELRRETAAKKRTAAPIGFGS
jgi:transitional endoplasmic reticulum ATPase